MFLVKKRGDDGVQSNGFSLSGGTGHEQVRHLGEVGHEGLVADGLAETDGQVVFVVLELVGVEDVLHGHNLRVGVRHLDADGALARDGRDDTDAEGGEAQRDVVLQVLDFADANAFCRYNLVQGNGRSDGGENLLDFNAETLESLFDTLFLLAELLHLGGFVDDGGLVVEQQVGGGELVVRQVEARVVVL